MTNRPTRYAELSYTQTGTLWRIVANDTGATIGPHYATKAELLADLARYAKDYGCDLAHTVAEIGRERQLYLALQKCAGALACALPEDRRINFTGEYADLGTMTVGQILDEADKALEET